MNITCISHNRHENIPNLFEVCGTTDITFFVANQQDYENYLSNGATNVIISGSLMDSRNKAIDYSASKNNICIQISDDLEKISINDFTGKRTKQTVTLIEVLNDIVPHFKNSKYMFAGFPPTDNPFFALGEYDYNKFIVGDFILIKPTELRFDTNMRLKEDYDFALQHMQTKGGVIRYGKYLTSFKHYSNKGGAVAYRNDQLEQETIKYLKSKWGECIKDNPKRPNEILLNRKSYQILTSNQTSLF